MAISSHAAERVTGESVGGWPGVKYARMVGYYFVPELDGKFSSIGDNGLNVEALTKYKQQEQALQPGQIDRLLQASFASKVRFAQAACYAPHHVFVFYNEAACRLPRVSFASRAKASQPGRRISRQNNPAVLPSATTSCWPSCATSSA